MQKPNRHFISAASNNCNCAIETGNHSDARARLLPGGGKLNPPLEEEKKKRRKPKKLAPERAPKAANETAVGFPCGDADGPSAFLPALCFFSG